MAKIDLTHLVLRAQKGDSEALNSLMEQCYEKLFYYAYNTVKNEDLAADITQESCLEIIRTLDKLRNPEAFLLWASRIVSHRCMDHYRQTKNEVALEENEDGETILDCLPDESRGSLPEQVQEDKEFQKIMWQMLDSLPAEQRQALLLYYFDNLSVAQIAEIQGKPEGTVKSRLNYGRKAVIAQVDAYEKKTGVRLHSLAPLPLLLWFLFRENKTAVLQSASGAVQKVWSGVSAAATVGTAAGTTTGTAAATGVGIGAKIAAGIAAVAVAAGAVAGGIALSKKAPAEDIPEPPKSAFSEYAGHWTCIPVDDSEDGLTDVTEPLTIRDDGILEYMGQTYQLRMLDSEEPTDGFYEMAATPSGKEVPESGELTQEDAYIIYITDYDDGMITRLHQVYTDEYGPWYEQIASFYRESDYADYTAVTLTEENVLNYLRIDSISFGVDPVDGQDMATVYAHYGIGFDLHLGSASYCNLLPTVEYQMVEAVVYRDEDPMAGPYREEGANLNTLQIQYDALNTVGRGIALCDSVSYENTISLKGQNSMVTQITSKARLIEARDVYGVVFVPNDQSEWEKQHHHYFEGFYLTDADTHQGVCSCGETLEPEAHAYQNFVCKACNERQSSQGLEYALRGDCYAATGIGTCTDAEVCIPSCYQGLPVAYIGTNAFRDCKTITSVVIPSSVHTVEQWAFMNCENLTVVHFSQGLQKIEDLAFIWCTSLQQVYLPRTVSEMGHSVFNECAALNFVELPEGLTEIQHGMFSNCDNLRAVYIPASVTQIGDKTFWHCTNLERIEYGGTMAQWDAVSKLRENTWELDGTTWCSDTGDFIVSCIDGEISKP